MTTEVAFVIAGVAALILLSPGIGHVCSGLWRLVKWIARPFRTEEILGD